MDSTCYLYFIRSNGPAQIAKIGISEVPERRLMELQVSNPYKLEILAVVPAYSSVVARQMEKQAHRMFSYSKLNGEWFKYDKVLREFIAATQAWSWEIAQVLAQPALKKKRLRAKIKKNIMENQRVASL